LKKQNPPDSIKEVDNPCNTELLKKDKQEKVLVGSGSKAFITVNGK
jgi:hypothetical protein